jgi:phage terminase large subunit
MKEFSIYEASGTGYERGWYTNCKCRYRLFKGARNTKKSYDMIGLEVLHKILSDKRRNILILRNVCSSNEYSTFATLKSLIYQPMPDNPDITFEHLFTIKEKPMEITVKKTGQKILFGGMLNATKLTSTRTPRGYLTDVYIEEGFELKNFEDFRKLDGTIRGKLPDGLFHQITICFNAWNINHWLYEEFFKGRLEDDYSALENSAYIDFKDESLIMLYGRGLYLHISTFRINEFRDKEIYDVAMAKLKEIAPEIYKVEALGMWGNATESTYPEFNESLIRPRQELNKMDYFKYAIGIDTGLSNGEGKIKRGENVQIRSATTMQLVGLTQDCSTLCCLDEFFHSNEVTVEKKTEPQLMEEIIDKIIMWKKIYNSHDTLMKGMICVYVDCADIGFRQGLELVAKEKGLFNVKFMPSTKLKIQTRVDFIRLIMAWGEFLISDSCVNLKREIKNSRKGDKGEVRSDIDDHCINANEYAWASIINFLKRWKEFKQR